MAASEQAGLRLTIEDSLSTAKVRASRRFDKNPNDLSPAKAFDLLRVKLSNARLRRI